MRIGITGSRALTVVERRTVRRILRGILSCYDAEDELHHGGASGVDRIAAEVADSFGMKVVSHPAKNPRWDGMAGYKARNMDIVNSSDKIYAFHSPSSSTGGTIWTYNYAKEIGKDVDWISIPSSESLTR